MAFMTVCIAALLAIGITCVAGDLQDREGCTDEDKGSNGLYPKHCYDVLDQYGECLVDIFDWFQDECSRSIDDTGYTVLHDYQDAINNCFATPDCKEIPYTW